MSTDNAHMCSLSCDTCWCCALRVCVARERLRECVRLLVSTVVSFSWKGRCTESQHTGLSQRAFPKGETPATAHPHRRDSPSPRLLCASRQDPEPPALFLLDNNSTQTSDRLCQFRSLGLPCGALSLYSSNWASHTRLPRHRTSVSRVAGLCAQQLVSLRLDS